MGYREKCTAFGICDTTTYRDQKQLEIPSACRRLYDRSETEVPNELEYGM